MRYTKFSALEGGSVTVVTCTIHMVGEAWKESENTCTYNTAQLHQTTLKNYDMIYFHSLGIYIQKYIRNLFKTVWWWRYDRPKRGYIFDFSMVKGAERSTIFTFTGKLCTVFPKTVMRVRALPRANQKGKPGSP